MRKNKLKIAVLMGGPSTEHEVSLNTGKEILANLDKAKYLPTSIVIAKDGTWPLRFDKLNSYDVVFIAMHGKYGEDGTAQGLLDAIEMPYTGSGVLASALGMDKPRSLALFREAGILVPDFEVVRKNDSQKNQHATLAKWVRRFSLPLVVKPADHGSSVGVTIVKKKEHIARGIQEAGKYSDEIVIQKFIRGRELTCGVIELPRKKLQALPPIEIVPRLGAFYDYKSKYMNGGSEHMIPPRDMSVRTIKNIQASALLAHNVIGAAGMSRTDFILTPDGKLYILEINTIPGMTSTSLLPQAAAAAGIPFPKLLDLILRSALRK